MNHPLFVLWALCGGMVSSEVLRIMIRFLPRIFPARSVLAIAPLALRWLMVAYLITMSVQGVNALNQVFRAVETLSP